MNTPKFSMAYGAGAPSAPSPPNGACGVVTNVEAITKAKKTGGTFTVNVATLDTGVQVDFGFKPVPARIGDTVSWVTQKQYGVQKFVAADAMAGSLPPAYPPRVPMGSAAASAPSTTATGPAAAGGSPPAYRAAASKPFPLPRDHGDTAIIRQNSLTNAVKAIELAMTASGDGEMPSIGIKTIEELEQRIIQTAYKFAAFSSGHLDAMLADDIAKAASGK